MRTRRSLQLALAVSLALLAAGTTFAWAGVLVGGHRADRIGTFEPVAQHLSPAGSPEPSGSSATARPKTTTASLGPTASLPTTSPGEATAPTTAGPPTSGRGHSDNSTSPTTDDNGRGNDD